MKVFQEETFGPVLTVTSYETEEEAINLANATAYGLSSNVWGSDLKRAQAVASRIDTGMVAINDWVAAGPGAPIGGAKQSGLGSEIGPESALNFTQFRQVYTALDRDPATRAFALGCAGFAEPPPDLP